MKKKEELIYIHNKLFFTIFSNFEKYIRLNTLAKDTGFHWTTVKRHIQLMSISYKQRNKIKPKRSAVK